MQIIDILLKYIFWHEFLNKFLRFFQALRSETKQFFFIPLCIRSRKKGQKATDQLLARLTFASLLVAAEATMEAAGVC